MTFLHTPAESPMYPPLSEHLGYVPNYARVFALVPDAYEAWIALGAAVRAGMDFRRYELVTWQTARLLRSPYCTVAHAGKLVELGFTPAAVRNGLEDGSLAPDEVAILDFVARIAADPGAATAEDYAALRGHGLSEQDIMHVVLAVTIRRFFAGTLDAVGAAPDPELDRPFVSGLTDA